MKKLSHTDEWVLVASLKTLALDGILILMHKRPRIFTIGKFTKHPNAIRTRAHN